MGWRGGKVPGATSFLRFRVWVLGQGGGPINTGDGMSLAWQCGGQLVKPRSCSQNLALEVLTKHAATECIENDRCVSWPLFLREITLQAALVTMAFSVAVSVLLQKASVASTRLFCVVGFAMSCV